MRYLALYNKLNLMGEKEYIENLLVFNLSQVLAGIKPASTIALKRNKENSYDKWYKYGIDFVKSLNLDFVELRKSNDGMVLMIYDPEVLKDYIFNKEAKSFLIKLGYCYKEDLKLYVNKLRDRYKLFNCPHELGLFLGIPIKDVEDFMTCTSKKCLFCGYWKVYNDCDKAMKTFKKYDEVKVSTIDKILKGSDSRELALNIKNFEKKHIQV